MANPLSVDEDKRGAYHPDLLGGDSPQRFRPRRVSAQDLSSQLSCEFLLNKSWIGPVPVLDLSPTGVAIEQAKNVILPPGSTVDALRIHYQGSLTWNGKARVVYQVAGPPPRIGLRFTSKLFDLQLLRISDRIVDRRLAFHLDQQAQFESLPAEWCAEVTRLRLLLRSARDVLAAAETQLSEDPAARIREERLLFDHIFQSWGPRFHSLASSLHESSKKFCDGTLELARAFASREILPEVFECPIHSRAFEKPLGYAGDYRIMLMLINTQLKGDSIYARFLHFVTQRYSLARTVCSRESLIRSELSSRVGQGEPLRIAALACGPAIEIERLLNSVDQVKAPTEFILIDQDEETMQFSHESLSRALLRRGNPDAHLVSLNGLHLSVVQVLRPRDEAEAAFIRDNLSDLDVVYSAGLYDYLPRPIAKRLTRRIYGMLKPGGKLLLANLEESPDSTWMMEFVTSWFLEYRDEEAMLELSAGLEPSPDLRRVVRDETGKCLFLEVVRPA